MSILRCQVSIVLDNHLECQVAAHTRVHLEHQLPVAPALNLLDLLKEVLDLVVVVRIVHNTLIFKSCLSWLLKARF